MGVVKGPKPRGYFLLADLCHDVSPICTNTMWNVHYHVTRIRTHWLPRSISCGTGSRRYTEIYLRNASFGLRVGLHDTRNNVSNGYSILAVVHHADSDLPWLGG